MVVAMAAMGAGAAGTRGRQVPPPAVPQATAGGYNCSARPNNVTVVEVVATSAYDAGFQLGRASASRVAAFLALPDVAAAVAYAASGAGAALSASMLAVTQAAMPRWVEEMAGLADGAGVARGVIVAVNQLAELQTVAPPAATSSPPATHCTDILLAAGAPWLAHNEDNEVGDADIMFLARVNYTAAAGGLTNYTAYMYPGQLATTAFGFNAAGLYLSQNAVFPTITNASGIPAEVLSRSIINATSLADALALLTSTPAAGGSSFNLGHVADATGLFNVEISPFGVTSVLPVPTPAPAPADYYFHVNMYRHTPVPQVPDTSSIARLARLQAMPPPTSPADLRAMLGDTANATWPIYRNGSEPDAVMTLMTALFTGAAGAGTMTLYANNPKYCPPFMTLPIAA